MADSVKFSDFVNFQLKCFKIIGLFPYEVDKNQSTKEKFLKTVYRYFVVISLTFFLCTLLISIWQSRKNLAESTEHLSTFGYAFMGIARIISINFRKKEFQRLMETLSDIFPGTKKDQIAFEVSGYYKRFNRMRIALTGFIMTGGIIFLVGPFEKLVSTGNWINKLPFPNWYPFDQYNLKIYNFVLLSQMYHITCINVTVFNPDIMLYACSTLISMEFDILCKRLRGLEKCQSDEVVKELNILTERHDTLLKISEDLQRVFSVSIFVNFSESSLLICLYGYLLSLATNLTDFIHHANLLLVTLVQVFMMCFYGTKLTTASAQVEQATYDSGWHCRQFKGGKILSKSLMMVIQRAQKPTHFTIFGFSHVSLEVYATVCSCIHSFKHVLY